MAGRMESGVDLRYLADSSLLLRYFEAVGEARKANSVVKTRTVRYERSNREFTIRSDGVTIGAPLKGFCGMLGGARIWDGQPADVAYPASASD